MSTISHFATWWHKHLSLGEYRRGRHSQSAFFTGKLAAQPVTVALLVEDLSNQPLTPAELNEQVEAIHKDLQKDLIEKLPTSHSGFAEATRVDFLRQVVSKANLRIYQRFPPGAAGARNLTIIVTLLVGKQLTIAHLGNSRAYLWRAGQLYRLTLDHTQAQALVSAGKITRDEEQTHPTRANLLRSLGGQRTVEVDTQVLEPASEPQRARPVSTILLKSNDCLLLCSTSVAEKLTKESIVQTLYRSSLARAAKRLVKNTQRRAAPNAHALLVPYQFPFYRWGQQVGNLLLWPLLILLVFSVGWPIISAHIAPASSPTATLAIRAATTQPPTVRPASSPVVAQTSEQQGRTPRSDTAIRLTPVVVPSATATRLATSLPLPPVPAIPTVAITPTLPAPATPSPPLATATPSPAVVLLAPLSGASGAGKQDFRWQPNFTPLAGEGFEVVFWEPGQTPDLGLGIASPTTAHYLQVDLSALAAQRNLQEKQYFWGVFWVKIEPFQRLRFLGGNFQFTYVEKKAEPRPKATPAPECTGEC